MKTIDVKVISDFICPWCWIGHAHLKSAIEQAGLTGQVRVQFAPFELNPQMPAAGLDRKQYRTRKFGSWERSQAMDADVTHRGQQAGLAFNYEVVNLTPNTRAAHRLMRYAQRIGEPSQVAALFEALFAAYFSEGRDIGSVAVLVDVAGANGFDAEAVRTHLTSIEDTREVVAEELQAQTDGVHSVPTLLIAGERVSGAQAPELLAQSLRMIAADQSAA
jgi:predicted DsbA family dithiol-disulfide isomerase